MRLLTIGLMATALLVSGCSKNKKKGGSESKSGHDHSMHSDKPMGDSHMGHDHSMHGMGDSHAAHDHGMHRMAAGGKVTIPKAGRKFKPPIQKSQVPDGAWFCDMGTVEYARGEKGDGKCPVCGMKLKQKLAAK